MEKIDYEPRYKRGIETKSRIYQCAKSLFYNIGYKKATIEKIAQEADVPVGLVSYYFKKDDILSQIYSEYIFSIVDCIETQLGDRLENHLQQHLLVNQLFYSRILGDEANREAYREIFVRRLVPSDMYELISGNWSKMIREFELELTKDYCDKLILAELGARRELVFHRFENLDPVKDKDFYYFLGTIAGRLVGIAPDAIELNLQKADRLFDSIDPSGISFLT